MKISLKNALIDSVNYLPSPHFDARPDNTVIDMIVIHGISLPPSEFGTGAIEKFFCGKLNHSEHAYFSTIAELKVSAHLLIDRKGAVTQFVPFSKRAWHAGLSFFKGKERCNDFSIGIELEGTDVIPYEEKQYQTLAAVIKLLMKTYPAISRDRLVGHSDIAPGRKSDPGPAFDWVYLDCLLQA